MEQNHSDRLRKAVIRFFTAIEKYYLDAKLKAHEYKELSPERMPLFDSAFTKEYYYLGLRFLVGTTNHIMRGVEKTYLHVYLRAQYIGNYETDRPLPSFMPEPVGYIPLFSKELNLFELCNFKTILDDAFVYMKERKRVFRTDMQINILEMNTEILRSDLEVFFEKADSHLGACIEERQGRNPFTLKDNDLVWIIRVYSDVTLLIGKHLKRSKFDNVETMKFSVFAKNEDVVLPYTPRMGYKEQPKSLSNWTLIYGENYFEMYGRKVAIHNRAILSIRRYMAQVLA